MREIKFRGLRADGKGWVYGYYSPVNVPILGTLGHCINEGGYRAIDIEHSSLGQYTGLKDKNGKEVYEGDIVVAWSAGSKGTFQVKWRQDGAPMWLLYPNFQDRQHWNISATEYGTGKIIMDVSGQIVGVDKIGFYDDGLEVIGNIHQNPELLKGGIDGNG